MRRVVSLWLPRFATECRLLMRAQAWRCEPSAQDEQPLALVAREGQQLRLAALNGPAEAAGLTPGLPLAEARALLPALRSRERDPLFERRALERLCDWAQRFSPWVAYEALPGENGPCDGGAAGLWLDITGCAHLFGGEEALLDALLSRLSERGLTARAGLADTPGAAWAAARFLTGAKQQAKSLEPGGQRAALAGLPVAALRLEDWQEELLARFGLIRVGALYGLPPAGLEPRLGRALKRRLEQALGGLDEPLSPRRPQAPFEERLVFGEPIASAEDIERGVERLILALCRRLRAAGQGLRRLRLTAHRVDGSCDALALGVSRATRDSDHLRRLLAQHLEGLDPGFGVEVLSLEAERAESLGDRQLSLSSAEAAKDAAALVDRLAGRLGEGRVFRVTPRESHWPEAAQKKSPPLPERRASNENWAPWRARSRPLRLLPNPEPIEALALLPDSAPARFLWRRQQHQVTRAEGPERILPEWWSLPEGEQGLSARDYFRVEDAQGRRFWLFRVEGRWYLHGLFG
jgi:protein ImuB